MKWKAKPIPKEGQERWTLIFAWVPHRCNDGYVRWLSELFVRQKYYADEYGSGWMALEYSAVFLVLGSHQEEVKE